MYPAGFYTGGVKGTVVSPKRRNGQMKNTDRFDIVYSLGFLLKYQSSRLLLNGHFDWNKKRRGYI